MDNSTKASDMVTMSMACLRAMTLVNRIRVYTIGFGERGGERVFGEQECCFLRNRRD